MRISDWSSDVCSSDLAGSDMDDGADFSFDGARSFKITSARDWNIFDHWSDDWPDKEHYVSQHAVTQDQCEAFGTLLASGANERDLEKIGRASCRERVCQYV